MRRRRRRRRGGGGCLFLFAPCPVSLDTRNSLYSHILFTSPRSSFFQSLYLLSCSESWRERPGPPRRSGSLWPCFSLHWAWIFGQPTVRNQPYASLLPSTFSPLWHARRERHGLAELAKSHYYNIFTTIFGFLSMYATPEDLVEKTLIHFIIITVFNWAVPARAYHCRAVLSQ